MSSHNLRWTVFLVVISIGVLATAILSEDPIRAGYITSKDYDPAHWVSTGKSGYMASESWDVSISSCQPGYQTSDCGWGNYGVSESTYSSSRIGDYIRFSDPNPVWDALGRIVLIVVGLLMLACSYIIVDGLLDELLDSLPFGLIGVLLLILCLVLGEGLLFVGVKGPTGLLT